MKRFFLTCVIALILVSNYAAQKPNWLKKLEKIIPLESTQQDVTSIFSELEESDYPYFRIYNLKDGELTVYYSLGYCTELKRKGWDVSEFTVTEISFSPKKQVKPEKLGIDLTTFKLTEIDDVPGAFIGRNNELGIEFVKKRKGNLEYISFYPPSKFDHLYCKE